jgi:hypothetical protein
LLYEADERQRGALRLPVILHGPGADGYFSSVREAFGLQEAEDLVVVDQAYTQAGTSIYMNFTRNFRITGDELAGANGTVVTLGGTLTLNFDTEGALVSYDLRDVAQSSVEGVKRSLVDLVKNDEIYYLMPKELPDIENLVAMGKRYYLRWDEAGNKRVETAYVD